MTESKSKSKCGKNRNTVRNKAVLSARFLSLVLCVLCLFVFAVAVFAEEPVPGGDPEGGVFAIGWDMNADGITDVVENYADGELPVSPRNGQKAGNAQYEYVFTGWSPEIVPVNGPAVYTAQFDQVLKTYLIRSDTDGDGVIDYSERLPYGVIPDFAAAEREDTERYDFTFTGWSSDPVTVREDAVYLAKYDCHPLTDKARGEYEITLTVLNSTGEDQWLIVKLTDGDVCVDAVDLRLPSNINETLTFSGLRKNCYSLQIVSALEDDLCFLTQSVVLRETDTNLSLLMSGKGTTATVKIDPLSDVVTLALPRSLLRNETGDRSYSLYASVTKFDFDTVPYRETLELLAGERHIGMYLQLLLQRETEGERTVTAFVGEAVTMAIRLPETLLEAIGEDVTEQITFYRVWDGRSEVITSEPNISGEYFEYVDGLAVLHVRGSGYYAMAYERGRPAASFWWLLFIVDLLVGGLILMEFRRHFMEYYLRILISLGLTAILVLVLALHSDIASIIFACLSWLMIVWLLIGKSSGQPGAPKTTLGNDEGLFDAFSANRLQRPAETWSSFGQGSETVQTEQTEKTDNTDERS